MYGSFYGEGSKQSLVASKVRTLFYFPAEEKKLESIDHIKQNGEKRREIRLTRQITENADQSIGFFSGV